MAWNTWMLALVALLILGTENALGRPGYQSLHKVELSPTNEDGSHNIEFDQAAILGSARMENYFNKLTPSQAVRELRMKAKNIDTNNNGFVTAEELIRWVHASFRNYEREEALIEFLQHDRDLDWRVSWEEYTKTEIGYLEELIENNTDFMEHFNRTSLLMKDSRIRFDAADTDKDGQLSEKEYVAFQYPADFEYMHEVEFKLVLNAADQDRDGKISLKEFLGARTSKPKTKNAKNQKEMFNVYDKNGDGFLDKPEMFPWILRDNWTAARAEAGHLITVGDEDGDGQLSIDEFLDHLEDFVGSHAMFPREEL